MANRSMKRLKSSHHQQTSLTSFFASKSGQPAGEEESKEEQNPSSSIATAPATAQRSSARDHDAKSLEDASSSLDPIVPHEVKKDTKNVMWNSHNQAIIYRQPRPKEARTKVAAFDMDGTLLVWRTSSWPSDLNDYELWNGSVITKMQELYDTQHYQLLIITNQGGIRKAHSGKRAERVRALLDWLAFKVERPLSAIMSTDKKMGYHKPSVKIWQTAQGVLGSKKSPWNIAESFFVGDSVGGDDDPQGGTDIGLAANVSAQTGETLQFHTPTDYFGPSSASRRSKTVDVPVIPEQALKARAAFVSGSALTSLPVVLLLCGAQGSGKSTFASQLPLDTFSQDTIRDGKPGTRQQVEMAVRAALTDKRSVIVDRMHLDPLQRAHFVDIAKECGVTNIHAVVFDPPVAVLTKRVKERQNHIVSGEKGAELAKRSASALAYPSYDEGFTMISTVKNEPSAEILLQRYMTILSAPALPLPEYFPLQHTESSLERLPAILVGTMKMGRRTAAGTVTQVIEAGIAGVDCAPTYNNEDLVGQSLLADSFCITKVPKRATTAAEVLAELDSSLSKLKRSSVDLLLLHWPAEPERMEELWRAMESALRSGKTRALGVCNFNVAALTTLFSFCVVPPVVLQVERHPLLPQWDLIDFCAQRDIQMQAHTPLGQGKEELFKAVQPIARNYEGYSTAQVMLAWNIQQGIAVIPKCSTNDHLEELKALPTLSADDLMAINGLVHDSSTRFVSPPFMYGSGAFCWGKQFLR